MIEHVEIMNTLALDPFGQILDALRRSTAMEVDWETVSAQNSDAGDGQLTLRHNGILHNFSVTWKATLESAAALTVVRAKFEGHSPHVLATTYMSPYLAEKCREIGLQFIDTAGNAYLESGDLLIYVTGRRPSAAVQAAKSRGASNPTTLRMIFALLRRPTLLQASYREIAEASGIALGSVGSVFQDLASRGWLVNASIAPRRRFTAPDRLLDEWVANYPSILRPRLQGRRFEAAEPDWWRKAPPTDFEHAYWSGEVAAEKLTGHLRAETQTLYVIPEHKAGFVKRLVQTHRLRPQSDGSIEILDVFWPPALPTSGEAGIAPMVLVYADLMASLSSRNLETAAKLRAGEIQHALDQF